MPHNDGAISLESYPALRFQPDTLDRVTRIEAPSEGVLSVYLDVDPSEMQREGFEASLLDLWKPLRAEMKGTDLEERLEQEIDRVNAYVRSWDEPPGRSVAIFSSAPGDLLRACGPRRAGARWCAVLASPVPPAPHRRAGRTRALLRRAAGQGARPFSHGLDGTHRAAERVPDPLPGASPAAAGPHRVGPADVAAFQRWVRVASTARRPGTFATSNTTYTCTCGV